MLTWKGTHRLYSASLALQARVQVHSGGSRFKHLPPERMRRTSFTSKTEPSMLSRCRGIQDYHHAVSPIRLHPVAYHDARLWRRGDRRPLSGGLPRIRIRNDG